MLCNFCLAGTGVPQPAGKGREGESGSDPAISICWWRRMNPRAASDGGAWEDAPPGYNDHRRFPELPSTIPEAILEFSNVAVYIWALLCFDLFDYFFLLCCKHVIVGESA